MITAALIIGSLVIIFRATSAGWSDVLSPARNDLVFAGRNQAYGAYRIRREHHRTMLIALLSGLGMVGVLVLLPALFRTHPSVGATPPPVDIDDRIFQVVDIVIPRATTPVPRPPAPKPGAPTSGTGPIVAVDSVPHAPLDTAKMDPGPTPGPAGGPPDPPPGDAPGDGPTGNGHAANNGVRDGWELESLPEYPGGEVALHRYLTREMKYPHDAIHERAEGRVLVGFIVRSDGSVTDVHVLKGISPSIDAEAQRVVRKMIKWIPGKFNKRDVDVRYALPIVFKLRN